MRRIMLSFGCFALFFSGMSVSAFADEQDEIEQKLLANVKQQQELLQQAQALQKQLEEIRAKASGYVTIKVKGKLILTKGDAFYGVRANRGAVVVRLVRGEDKNREPDEYLKTLEGKTVVVEGFLFRIEAEGKVIDVEVHDKEQVKWAEEK